MTPIAFVPGEPLLVGESVGVDAAASVGVASFQIARISLLHNWIVHDHSSKVLLHELLAEDDASGHTRSQEAYKNHLEGDDAGNQDHIWILFWQRDTNVLVEDQIGHFNKLLIYTIVA